MSFLEFTVPPFPVFIAAGEGVFKKGETHVRRVFPVFDLLYVKEGVLYITEDENAFSVEAGEYILLSPGLEHYGTKGSEETTSYSWLHFEGADYEVTETTGNNWSELRRKKGSFEEPSRYRLSLPQKGKVRRPQFMAGQFSVLTDDSAENSDLPLRKQILFEEPAPSSEGSVPNPVRKGKSRMGGRPVPAGALSGENNHQSAFIGSSLQPRLRDPLHAAGARRHARPVYE
ncbi:AraC family ligand binding domain-containing protein [Bacillus velezensis]|nr:AraC family ligand binding domain-containing protein [Bacillus velezensis]